MQIQNRFDGEGDDGAVDEVSRGKDANEDDWDDDDSDEDEEDDGDDMIFACSYIQPEWKFDNMDYMVLNGFEIIWIIRF